MRRAPILARVLSGHNPDVMQSVNDQGAMIPDLFSTRNVDGDPCNTRSTVRRFEGLSCLLALCGAMTPTGYADCKRGTDVQFGTLVPDVAVNRPAENCCGWGNERADTNVLRRAFLKGIHDFSVIEGRLPGIFGLHQGLLEKKGRPGARSGSHDPRERHNPLCQRVLRRDEGTIMIPSSEQIALLVGLFPVLPYLVAAIAVGMDYLTSRRQRGGDPRDGQASGDTWPGRKSDPPMA
jgi:hypothetical protein